MTTLDKILTFIAACLNALLAADPFRLLPVWAQVIAACLVAGFAAIGIYAPTPIGRR